MHSGVIPVFCHSGRANHPALDVIAAAGYSLRVEAEWSNFRAQITALPNGVVVSTDIRCAVNKLLWDFPDRLLETKVIIATGDAPDNLCQLAGIRVRGAVATSNADAILKLLATDRWEAGRQAAVHLVRTNASLPVALKRGLHLLFNNLPLTTASLDGGAPSPPRSVVSMAAALGYSERYLSRLACEAGIPLGRIIHGWTTLSGLRMLQQGATLNDAAQLVGMPNASSLSDACLRFAGSRPSRLDPTTIDRLVSQFTGQTVAWLTERAPNQAIAQPEKPG